MQPQEMRPLVQRDKSFRPFRVYLDDGRVYEIKDPRLTLVSDIFVIGLPDPNDPHSGIAEDSVFVGWSEIVKVEMMAPAASA
jgi:hypothetical protein